MKTFETSSCNIGGGGHIIIQVPYMDAFYLNLSPKVFFMKSLYSEGV